MGISFTQEQLQVIESRNRNLLVSAAAGSGKTAVLVERIIRMIIDAQNPINIDELLIVTFTNAAATEMRERISEAILKKLEEKPDRKELHKQLVLIANANIMTIHSFCLKVIRNHYDLINLDPSFRIGDENELYIIKKNVIEELLEEWYENNRTDFIEFTEQYIKGNTDEQIEELIINLHKFSMSNPWPQAWISEKTEALNFEDVEKLKQSIFFSELKKNSLEKLQFSKDLILEARFISFMDNGPEHYQDAIAIYMEGINNLQQAIEEDYEKAQKAFDSFDIPKLASKSKGFDKDLRDEAKELIDSAKKIILELKDKEYNFTMQQIQEDIKETYYSLTVLKELVIDFSNRFSKAKEERNIIDFNDVEHLALKLLIEKTSENEFVPTEIAKRYQDQFQEVLIDEYQDSNLVQETILNSVSRINLGTPNVFMVGDVKQSIYKFRLAKPELFMEKYEEYSNDESLYQKINLHHNFRSRKQIIEAINIVFEKIMSKNLGDVLYNEEASLNYKAGYEPLENSMYNPELILIEQEESEEEDSDEKPELQEISLSKQEAEAKAVAQRIYDMVNDKELEIFDKEIGERRPVRYKDIVVLLRSTIGWTDNILKELKKKDIPCYSNSSRGYFDTLEIKTLLHILRIIDNPRQDIPFVTVLRSPIIALKGKELAKIRKAYNGDMIDAAKAYIEGSLLEDELAVKLELFLEQLEKLRTASKYLAMDQLIYKIFEVTNYDYYVALMKNGAQRTANLEMFIDKAVAFENTSYSGIFNFIRYMDGIKKFEMDMGEASIYSEKDDLVRIMTIHKSKGLEFPVVFVSGLGKKFDFRDAKKSIVFHQDLGIASDYVNAKDRYQITTLPKKIINNKIKKETLSEELRVLYVAMTRAKEKLIMTGTIKNLENKEKFWEKALIDTNSVKPIYLDNCENMLDWIMGAVYNQSGYFDIHRILDIHSRVGEDELEKQKDVLSIISEWKSDELDSNIAKKLNWSYTFDKMTRIRAQLSVSEIKNSHSKKKINIMPMKLKEGFRPVEEEYRKLSAAEKGTAFHKVMQHLDFFMSTEGIEEYLQKLNKQGKISDVEYKEINRSLIENFLKSELCDAMKKQVSTLRKEVPFIIGIDAKEMYSEEAVNSDTEDIVMIQGVVDAFYEEAGQLVLVDYKTDSIMEGEESILVDRYFEQMRYYKLALEKILDKKVEKVLLYSAVTAKTVSLEF